MLAAGAVVIKNEDVTSFPGFDDSGAGIVLRATVTQGSIPDDKVCCYLPAAMKKLSLLLLALALPHFAWGQLMFNASLKGWNEVPPRETPAFGTGTATLDLATKLFELNYSFEGLVADQTAAHIHVAPEGANGGVLFPFPLGSPVSFSQTLTDAQIDELRSGLWYINVHSATYPGGEIRGQLLPVPEPSTYALGAVALLGAAVLIRRRLQQRQGNPPALA